MDSKIKIVINGLIYTEVLQGIKSDKELEKIENTLRYFLMVKDDNVKVYQKAVAIYRNARKKGKTIRRTIDCIIAATAVIHGYKILHKDSDYDLMEELKGHTI